MEWEERGVREGKKGNEMREECEKGRAMGIRRGGERKQGERKWKGEVKWKGEGKWGGGSSGGGGRETEMRR